MKVLKRGRLRAVRWGVALGVLSAFPFVGVGVAQAAIATAPPPTTQFRPDLRTVHVLSGLNGGRVEYCFDKVVSINGSGANFKMGGYRWDTLITGQQAILGSNNQCVDVLFNTDSGTLDNYTFGTVLPNAVNAGISGGQANLGDSVPNLDSTSKSGTTGHTTGPDLIGVATGPPAGTTEVTYSFDEPIDTSTVVASDFGYIDNAGNKHQGLTVTGTDGSGDVRIAFGVNTSNAVNGYVNRGAAGNGIGPSQTGVNNNGAVPSNSGNPETFNPVESLNIPGAPTTNAAGASPLLVSATEVGSNQISYTFNQNVSTTSTGTNTFARLFKAVASNGDEIQATNVVANGTTVLATFSQPNVARYFEELTVASVDSGAVFDNNVSNTNPPQGVPVGDNAGASASGYTNAPDAKSVSITPSSGQVLILFDQRVATNSSGGSAPVDQTGTTPTNLADFQLLDAQGNVLGLVPQSASVESVGPYASQVRLTYATTSGLNAAKAVELCGNQNSSGATPYTVFAGSAPCGSGPAVFTFGDSPTGVGGGMAPAGNIQQILAATTSGAALMHGSTKLVLHRVHLTSRQAAANRRREARRHHRAHRGHRSHRSHSRR